MTWVKTENIWEDLDEVLCGAVCLIFGWGSATFGHECCHLLVARSLGLTATLGELTLTTGSVFVQGDMTSVETMLVAVAGSLGLIIIGLLLIHSFENKMIHMIGVVFLCRAWIDALPLFDLDGGIFMQSACSSIGPAGLLVAWIFVILEVLVSGGAIAHAIKSGSI
uniref:Peptidase M50 domain-containing protein n=1 Tax=Candidatus Methanogaster sp. ANME-2c ERB4 TaxID=2759911 RepID=A0A7G9YLQ3_9EURY|nr:hypothetical protein JAJEHNPH_00015 [Methanosarcinales archaeon ANME-2c ERB4]QNO48937.1 hypothetical protein OEPDFBKK_00013 [Methanosarcinales archaeon ANME-2c ERB4]